MSEGEYQRLKALAAVEGLTPVLWLERHWVFTHRDDHGGVNATPIIP